MPQYNAASGRVRQYERPCHRITVLLRLGSTLFGSRLFLRSSRFCRSSFSGAGTNHLTKLSCQLYVSAVAVYRNVRLSTGMALPFW